MKITVAHSGKFDFKHKLYEPLRASKLNTTHDIHLPHEFGETHSTKEFIQACDAMVADVSLPSTPEGIEIGWASAYGVPVICMYETGSKVSGALKFACDCFMEYKDATEMIEKLAAELGKLQVAQ